LAKNFLLSEKARLTFRAEFFNLTNTVRFAPRDTSYGNPRFGAVTNQANQPRVIQFALRLAF
jgi:hypothetical protein